MNFILNQLEVLGFDTPMFLRAAVLLTIGSILLGTVGRFVFGKRSVLHCSISSAIGIIFIYVATVALQCYGTDLQGMLAPLPFMELKDQAIHFFSFQNAEITVICTQVLSIVILAFLVNLADGWLPKGKNLFTWLFFRVVTVAIGFILHLVVVGLFATYLPEGLVIYAPTVLLALLILMLLTGALKILVGAVLTTVNPIIGGLYTFFFATIIGKQVTKAVLTTAILCGLVFGLQYIGLSSISIALAALTAYIPFLLILVVLWYIVYRVF